MRGVICLCFLVWSMWGCGERKEEVPMVIPGPTVMEEVMARGTLRVCSYYNTTDYYVYKGVPKGFHYELVRDFAEHLGVQLEMVATVDVEEAIRRLEKGEVDLLAMSLTVTPERDSLVEFTMPLFSTGRVLVQHAGEGPLLRRVEELMGQEVFVQRGTNYGAFARALSDSLGLEMRVTELDSCTYEDILLEVEYGDLPRTVVDENVARTAARYMTHLDDSLALSGPVPVAWAVKRGEEGLRDEVNEWLAPRKGGETFNVLYNRYFKSSYVTTLRNSKYYKLKGGVISSFDAIIRREAAAIGWDWRLLASISYQESHFNPTVVSWAGAEGLMGIMPNTARALGVTPHELKNPDTGIRVGVDCLRRFRQGFSEIKNPEEKIKFTLAAYNAGIGHVYDAQRLAKKYGKDPTIWDNNVAEYIRLKNEPEYYNDPVCKHGYLRGSETFNYVLEVMERYHYYKEKT